MPCPPQVPAAPAVLCAGVEERRERYLKALATMKTEEDGRHAAQLLREYLLACYLSAIPCDDATDGLGLTKEQAVLITRIMVADMDEVFAQNPVPPENVLGFRDWLADWLKAQPFKAH
jgi:hypothetical protein